MIAALVPTWLQEFEKEAGYMTKEVCKCPTIDRGSFAKYVKRDIIRDGVNDIVLAYLLNKVTDKSVSLSMTDDILDYLHSQGVVLKVDRELPVCGLCEGAGLIGGPGINDCCPKCNGTGKIYCVGYVATEPLIEAYPCPNAEEGSKWKYVKATESIVEG